MAANCKFHSALLLTLTRTDPDALHNAVLKIDRVAQVVRRGARNGALPDKWACELEACISNAYTHDDPLIGSVAPEAMADLVVKAAVKMYCEIVCSNGPDHSANVLERTVAIVAVMADLRRAEVACENDVTAELLADIAVREGRVFAELLAIADARIKLADTNFKREFEKFNALVVDFKGNTMTPELKLADERAFAEECAWKLASDDKVALIAAFGQRKVRRAAVLAHVE